VELTADSTDDDTTEPGWFGNREQGKQVGMLWAYVNQGIMLASMLVWASPILIDAGIP
jgi:hypothetical protein